MLYPLHDVQCIFQSMGALQSIDSKAINPQAIVALKDALAKIYWYKNDLRSFLTSALGDSPLLVNVNWEDYKRNYS